MNVTFKGNQIIALDKPSKDFGGISTYSLEDSPKEIQSLKDGFYAIKGQEFKIKRNKYSDEIAFPLWEPNMIIDWIEEKWEAEYQKEVANGTWEESEYKEPSCSRCGDGGCPQCEPYRYI
jgi:hypothetical protein